MGTSETPNGRPASPLQQARKAQGMRQADVAEKAGCAISLVSMAEAGYQPAPKKAAAIAAAVGASTGSFW